MTETPQSPQAGIADAVRDLSDNSRLLVRREIDAAEREMWRKAKDGAPAFGLLAASSALGLLAAASSYRLTLRLLEKVLPPVSAALTAAAGYGAGAVCTAVLAARRLRDLPPFFPTETARQAGEAITDTAAQTRGDSPPGADA
jgi:hypothetical protein